MRIKDGEWINLFVDDGEESKKVKDVLTEKGIPFVERKWTGDFPVDIKIQGKGPPGDKKLGASTTLSPPVLEIYFKPGKTLYLGGLEKILEGIESEW